MRSPKKYSYAKDMPKFVSDATYESAIYLLDFGDCIKIGRTESLHSRMRAYDRPHCKPVVAFKYYYTPLIRQYETLLLSHFGLRSSISEYVLGVSFSEVVLIADTVLASNPYSIKRY